MRRLNRPANTAEHLRSAKNAPPPRGRHLAARMVSADWFERHQRRIEDYRLPRGERRRRQYMEQTGEVGVRLLTAVHDPHAPSWLRQIPAVEALRLWCIQEFVIHQPFVAPTVHRVLAFVKSSTTPADQEVAPGTARTTARYGGRVPGGRGRARVALVEALKARHTARHLAHPLPRADPTPSPQRPLGRTPPERTAPTCTDVACAAPSRTRPTRPAAEGNAAPWPRGTTSSRSAMRQPSSSRPSTSGGDQAAQNGEHAS